MDFILLLISLLEQFGSAVSKQTLPPVGLVEDSVALSAAITAGAFFPSLAFFAAGSPPSVDAPFSFFPSSVSSDDL